MTKKKCPTPDELLQEHAKRRRLQPNPVQDKAMQEMREAAFKAISGAGIKQIPKADEAESPDVSLAGQFKVTEFKTMNYLVKYIDTVVTEMLKDPDSKLVEQLIDPKSHKWTEEGESFLKQIAELKKYFTPRIYGAALKDIISNNGDISNIKDQSRKTLAKGMDMANFFEALLKKVDTDYDQYRDKSVDQDPSESPEYSDVELRAIAVDTLTKPIRLYPEMAKEMGLEVPQQTPGNAPNSNLALVRIF